MDFLTTLTFSTWTVIGQTVIFGILLTIGVRVALAMTGTPNASTRFAVWFLTLITIVLLPVAFFARTTFPLLKEQMETHSVEAKARPSTPAVRLPEARSSGVAAAPAVPVLNVVPPVHSIQPDYSFQSQVWIPFDVAAALLWLYVIVVGLLLTRLLFSFWRLKRLKSSASPVPPEVRTHFQKWLSLCETPRPVQLLLSAKARSPMAVGFSRPAIIIPESLLLRLTGEELDHLGLHELAHIRRHDDWTNLAQRVLQAIFFFHPAVHWICRKLEFEREVACDDWVLTLTGAAKPYAKSLAKILESTPSPRGLVLASGAVFRKRQIFRRIEMLLDGSRDSSPLTSGLTVVVILICVLGLVSEIIQMPALIAFRHDFGRSVHRTTWNMDGREIVTEMSGDIEFASDDRSVRSISPGGYLRIREKGWRRQELEVRPGDSPQPSVRYLVNGKEYPLDGSAREWIGTMLLRLIRETGINAEERTLRILEARGPEGVFDEVDRIESDHSRQKYLSAAIRSGKLEAEDLRRAMSRAGRISSDHDKANLLVEVWSFYNSEPLRNAYFSAVNTIGSDHDHRRVLAQVIEDSDDQDVAEQVARSVGRMGSDHDKAETLLLMAQRMTGGEPAAWRGWTRAAGSIDSDHDKARVLTAMIGAGQQPPEALEDILKVAAMIQSDHDKSQVLERAVQRQGSHGLPQAAFYAAAGTIQSDNDRARVLCSLIDHDLSESIPDGLAGVIQPISSDNDKANVLVKLASKTPTPAFLDAVRSIQSDNDKRRVIEAMVERGDSADAATSAVELAATISSDHDKTQVLAAIAEKHRDNPQVREALRKAADKIGSDSDYRRIMSKLFADPQSTPAARD